MKFKYEFIPESLGNKGWRILCRAIRTEYGAHGDIHEGYYVCDEEHNFVATWAGIGTPALFKTETEVNLIILRLLTKYD